MEKLTQDVVLSHTESELKLPPSPKRPRTDCTTSNGHSGKSRFHFPEPLTFQEACVTPSLTTLMPKSAGPEATAECGKDKYQKNERQLQHIQPLVLPMNKITPPHSDEANTGSSSACFIAPERSVMLVQDGQPPANETDKLSSYPPDDAGEALVESHTSEDASADSSSQPDCDCLGKSLEDEPPGGSNLPTGDGGGNGSQVQNSLSQIQAFNLSSSDEEVRCLSDFTCEGLLCDAGFCHTCSQCAGDEQYSQSSGEDGFSENMFLNENEADSLISSIVHTDSELFFLIPEKDPNGSMAEGVQREAEVVKMQLCEDEDFAVWDVKTKAQVNENGMSKNPIPSAAELAEGSIVSYDMVLVRNIGSETVSFEADDFCEAKRAHAVGKMIAKTESETADHTTETPMPARISQEPAEGDNDAGPFGVIDPAIWSESDGEAVEKRCESESAAGAELSTFVEISARDIPLCPDAEPPREDSASVHGRTHLCKDEKDFCQSFQEPRVSLTTTINETHNSANDEGSYEWKSSPSSSRGETPPGTEKTPESSDAVGRHSTEQDQSCCFPASLDDLLAQDVEYLLSELSRMDETTQIRKGNETLDVESNEHEKLERSSELKEKLQEVENYREDTSKMSVDDFLTEWVEENLSNKGESENNQECLSDHPYNVVLPTVEETPDESERKEAEDTQVNGSSEVLGKLMDSELKRDTTEVSPDEHIRGQSEAIKSQSGDELILNSQREQSVENCLWSVYQNRPETADPLESTSPTSSDAVVPSPHELRRPQTADQNPAAFISRDKCPLLPSALPFCCRASGAFDTFEKIELSRHNSDENDASLSNSPLLTSMPEQLLGTPQQQLYPTPEAESSGHEDVPQEEDEEGKEEDVERFECHTDEAADGLSSCDYSCDKLSNFISAADVPAHCSPEPKPDCESVFKSSESFQDEPNPSPVSWEVSSESNGSASDVNNEPRFEMKQQFDKVLKELNLFFDVSRSEFACYSEESSPEQYGDGSETWESEASNSKDPLRGCEKETSSDDADEVQRLDVCGCHPAASCSPDSGDGEQEVPLGSCQEVSVPTAEKHEEPLEMEPERKAWSPAFMSQPLLDQLIYRPPEPNRRLEPLKTCTRPLRVGLSKKAKTKHLHRPHPYK